MINLSHAKKAQALASDLEYRTKLHDYTVMPDDIKVQQAKKAYALQSEVRSMMLKTASNDSKVFMYVLLRLKTS